LCVEILLQKKDVQRIYKYKNKKLLGLAQWPVTSLAFAAGGRVFPHKGHTKANTDAKVNDLLKFVSQSLRIFFKT